MQERETQSLDMFHNAKLAKRGRVAVFLPITLSRMDKRMRVCNATFVQQSAKFKYLPLEIISFYNRIES